MAQSRTDVTATLCSLESCSAEMTAFAVGRDAFRHGAASQAFLCLGQPVWSSARLVKRRIYFGSPMLAEARSSALVYLSSKVLSHKR